MAETRINLDEPPANVPVVDEANQPWLEMDEVIAGQRELADTGKQDDDQTTKGAARLPGLEDAAPETAAAPITDEAETPALAEIPVFDYDQMVPLPDEREPISVSALKDSFIDAERSSEALQAKHDELMVLRREQQQLNAILGDKVTPEQRQRIAQAEQAQLTREHTAMLTAKPEWRDATAFEAARDSMFTAARRYGFNDNELKAISDHRVIAMLDALAGYQSRETRAVKDAVPVRQKAKIPRGQRPKARGKGLSKEQIAAISKSGSYNQKYDAMDQLLGVAK